jgi:hypothetical protein
MWMKHAGLDDWPTKPSIPDMLTAALVFEKSPIFALEGHVDGHLRHYHRPVATYKLGSRDCDL